jgi:parvulin-like peptidyl-prolyl isomerase
MEEVQLNLILAQTDSTAAAARDRIVNGEDFGEVAKEVSKHSSASQGGAIGWTPHDLLVNPLADAAFNQEIGKVSDVIETDNGFYIIRIDGKETRQLEDTTKLSLTKAYFGDKLEAASNTYELQNLVTVGQAQRIASHLQQASGG